MLHTTMLRNAARNILASGVQRISTNTTAACCLRGTALKGRGMSTEAADATQTLPQETAVPNCSPVDEVDKLYRTIDLEVRGHDPAVLRSYKQFILQSAKHLQIGVGTIWTPKPVHDRRTLLKSAFGHRKHLVQYEARTYFEVMAFHRLTGSTADTFLEYIERNVPEGVAMKVTKHEIQPLPEHLRERPAQVEESSS